MLERFVFDLEGRQTERSNVSVNLSCRCDTGSRRRVILHPQPRQEAGKKEDLPIGAAGVTRFSSAFPSTSLCLSPALMTSVCFTHLLHNISSVRRLLKKKRKTKCLRAEGRDRPISLKDLTNAIRQRFISELPLNGF